MSDIYISIGVMYSDLSIYSSGEIIQVLSSGAHYTSCTPNSARSFSVSASKSAHNVVWYSMPMEKRKEGSKSGGRDEWRPDRVRTFVFDSSILHSATELDTGPAKSKKWTNQSRTLGTSHGFVVKSVQLSYHFGSRSGTVEPGQH